MLNVIFCWLCSFKLAILSAGFLIQSVFRLLYDYRFISPSNKTLLYVLCLVFTCSILCLSFFFFFFFFFYSINRIFFCFSIFKDLLFWINYPSSNTFSIYLLKKKKQNKTCAIYGLDRIRKQSWFMFMYIWLLLSSLLPWWCYLQLNFNALQVQLEFACYK